MCDDCDRPTFSRRRALWVPPAVVGAALFGAQPAEAATRSVALLRRSAWGARPATGPFVHHQINHITIHHSAVILRDNRKAPAQLRAFQADHQARGWPDIAYHLLIDRHGNVYQGRPIGAVGDTNTSYNPRGHLLVMALGNFEEQAVSAAQFGALLNVLAWGSSRFGIAPAAIRGHRAYASTLCPGADLRRLIFNGTVRRRVRRRRGHVTMRTLSVSAGKARVRRIENGTD
jgi:N-acetylmuramoyl-L-alanine amidase-like protein